MSRILVTGGAGFIGSHLSDALVGLGHEVTIVDDLSSGNRANLRTSSDLVRFIEGDIRDIGQLCGDLRQVDAIVHLAALISGHDSLLEPFEYQRVNVEGTQALIDFAGQAGVARIVFASSSTVYGNQPEGPIGENQAPAPLSVYALTKLAGEHLLRLFAPIYSFSYCSLRLFNVYGPRQAPDHPYANVTCKFSHAAARGLTVPLYGDGQQSRDFVYVSDVVTAFLRVLVSSVETTYNVGTGHAVSINNLITALTDIRGAPLQTDAQPPWPNDIRTIRADMARMQREFGFRPEIPLQEGLRRTVAFFADGDL